MQSKQADKNPWQVAVQKWTFHWTAHCCCAGTPSAALSSFFPQWRILCSLMPVSQEARRETVGLTRFPSRSGPFIAGPFTAIALGTLQQLCQAIGFQGGVVGHATWHRNWDRIMTQIRAVHSSPCSIGPAAKADRAMTAALLCNNTDPNQR